MQNISILLLVALIIGAVFGTGPISNSGKASIMPRLTRLPVGHLYRASDAMKNLKKVDTVPIMKLSTIDEQLSYLPLPTSPQAAAFQRLLNPIDNQAIYSHFDPEIINSLPPSSGASQNLKDSLGKTVWLRLADSCDYDSFKHWWHSKVRPSNPIHDPTLFSILFRVIISDCYQIFWFVMGQQKGKLGSLLTRHATAEDAPIPLSLIDVAKIFSRSLMELELKSRKPIFEEFPRRIPALNSHHLGELLYGNRPVKDICKDLAYRNYFCYKAFQSVDMLPGMPSPGEMSLEIFAIALAGLPVSTRLDWLSQTCDTYRLKLIMAYNTRPGIEQIMDNGLLCGYENLFTMAKLRDRSVDSQLLLKKLYLLWEDLCSDDSPELKCVVIKNTLNLVFQECSNCVVLSTKTPRSKSMPAKTSLQHATESAPSQNKTRIAKKATQAKKFRANIVAFEKPSKSNKDKK